MTLLNAYNLDKEGPNTTHKVVELIVQIKGLRVFGGDFI